MSRKNFTNIIPPNPESRDANEWPCQQNWRMTNSSSQIHPYQWASKSLFVCFVLFSPQKSQDFHFIFPFDPVNFQLIKRSKEGRNNIHVGICFSHQNISVPTQRNEICQESWRDLLRTLWRKKHSTGKTKFWLKVTM